MTQETGEKILDTFAIVSEDDLGSIIFPLFPGDRIFLSGDLGAGKSTFIRSLLRRHFSDSDLIVRSPTYTYYQKYGTDVYHFDLYRLDSIEDVFLIGGEDIFDDPNSICLIEWPEVLGDRIVPTVRVEIEKTKADQRRFNIHPLGSTE